MKATFVSIAALLALVNLSEGHLYLMEPASRSFYHTNAFEKSPGQAMEHCPHCFQAGGVASVRSRGEKKTDPVWLESYGAGKWPLKYLYDDGMVADNGNYLEPEAISVRHGVCGDPAQGEPDNDNRYGIANSEFPVLENYEEGSIIEIKTVTSTYHWGHIEYFICDAKDLDDPNGKVTQECFNKYPLSRAPDDGDASPIDPAHAGRYLLDPSCRENETDQTLSPSSAYKGQVSTMRYVLPAGLTCDRCILQMVYYTGNSCQHPGYKEFNPTSLPKGCASSKGDWINPQNLAMCGEGNAYPEEFWNCADISIGSEGGGGNTSPIRTTPAPVSPMVEEPTPTPATMITTSAPADNVMSTPAPAMEVKTSAPTKYDGTMSMSTPAPTVYDDTKSMSTPSPAVTKTNTPGGPPSMISECAKPYEQCGGANWKGATCCTEHHECEAVATCYSQCRPIPEKKIKPAGGECRVRWQQCDGKNYTGVTCCDEGLTCKSPGGDDYFYHCV